MGWRYISYRTGFELMKRSGLLKGKFPIEPVENAFLTLKEWRKDARPFFFHSKDSINVNKSLSDELTQSYNYIERHNFPFFSSQNFDLGQKINWMMNVDTGYTYDSGTHWLDVNDLDEKSGDIKFVWEPSRFSHLYTIIRYDKHSGKDCSKQVFGQIESWISANKINQGPNFKCSQEISLRLLNWTFALYYYRNSESLTDQLFHKIQHYIYWQVEHVYNNINFSRIAVRNNHAITETLLLYLAGTLYPQLPGAKKWKDHGKRWFEEEIAYQVYEDGTYLQFSMNYHRVVVQLLTWALQLAELNGEKFSDIVYERAKSSLNFLIQNMDIKTGWLPNYGNNDGALFFKLNDAHYRDYRPQLEALSRALQIDWHYKKFEDVFWYGLTGTNLAKAIEVKNGLSSFDNGGYHLYRQDDALTFLRCGNHKDRPAQADNLHLDIWYKHKNLLHDAGTYKYNANKDDLRYFMGTRSHNTVMLDAYDQMEKGARFIWYHWTQCENIKKVEEANYVIIEGIITAFRHIDKKIRHKRTVKIYKYEPVWEITDEFENKPADMSLKQFWHSSYLNKLHFLSTDGTEKDIEPELSSGFFSSHYGKKETCEELCFSTNTNMLTTTIRVIE